MWWLAPMVVMLVAVMPVAMSTLGPGHHAAIRPSNREQLQGGHNLDIDARFVAR